MDSIALGLQIYCGWTERVPDIYTGLREVILTLPAASKQKSNKKAKVSSETRIFEDADATMLLRVACAWCRLSQWETAVRMTEEQFNGVVGCLRKLDDCIPQHPGVTALRTAIVAWLKASWDS